jgi:hypothetical protein
MCNGCYVKTADYSSGPPPPPQYPSDPRGVPFLPLAVDLLLQQELLRAHDIKLLNPPQPLAAAVSRGRTSFFFAPSSLAKSHDPL